MLIVLDHEKSKVVDKNLLLFHLKKSYTSDCAEINFHELVLLLEITSLTKRILFTAIFVSLFLCGQAFATTTTPLANIQTTETPLTLEDLQNPKKMCELNGINYMDAVAWVKQLQIAIHNQDKNAIANLVTYPLRINDGPKKTHFIKDQKQFLLEYSSIITTPVENKILHADSTAIFCNAQGGMIADGTIWFSSQDANLIKIRTINLSRVYQNRDFLKK